MELNGGCPTWVQFIQLVNATFGLSLTDSSINELAMLWRIGMVDEFSKRFIVLSYRDTSLTEAQQIKLFITGLGDPLRTDVALQQPSSLDDVVIFAQVYEQRNASCDDAQTTPSRNNSRPTLKPVALMSSSPSLGVTSVATPTNVLRLTPVKIARRHQDGK
jgi:hypothetical protein